HREQLRLALGMVRPCLLEEGMLVEDALVERPRVLGEAERRVAAAQLGEERREEPRVRDRQDRALRIDLDRRLVEPDVLAELEQAEPADALHAHAEPEREA